MNRLDRVVGSFLDYARPHAGNPIPLDLNAAVRRTVQILSSQITDGAIDVKLDLSEPLPRAEHRPGEVPAGADEPDPERHPGDGRARQSHGVDVRRAARCAAA